MPIIKDLQNKGVYIKHFQMFGYSGEEKERGGDLKKGGRKERI